MRRGYFQKWMDFLSEFPRLHVFNSEAASPFVISFACPPIPGEVILHHLEQEGLFVSTGSACAIRDPEPSHVLMAAGISREDALSSIRLSFSVYNTTAGLEQVFPAFRRAMDKVSRL